ncbi:hypothetical protein SELMODRAFT_406946 [Selaginella moellendorffii]|uniref:Uncharacterized protein n=1 Tax=Selaginella moellendorffii TaxID=88036 RepID=D8R3F5_SELML|nr:hypothetical protein SELMODRAFT_406946 [Selaginella moellendorffii]
MACIDRCFALGSSKGVLLDPELYWLVDGKPLLKCKVLLVASPKLIDFQEFYKDARTPQVFLPVWSAAEIALAWQEVFDPIQFMDSRSSREADYGQWPPVSQHGAPMLYPEHFLQVSTRVGVSTLERWSEGRTTKFGEVVEVEKLDDLQHPIPVNRTIWLESPVEETVNTFTIRTLPGKSVRGTSTTAIRSGAFLLEGHFVAVASELAESDGVHWHSSSGQRFIRKEVIRTEGNRIGDARIIRKL